MPDLDLSALRKVAEAARDNAEGIGWFSAEYSMLHGKDEQDAQHIAAFDPPTVLALLDELENARTTIEHDKRHFAKAWDAGAAALWKASGEGYNGEYPGLSYEEIREQDRADGVQSLPPNPYAEP